MAFLSDELLKIGRQMNYNSSEDFVYDCLNKMVKICFDSISGNTDKTKETIIPNFKRVHNTWNQVAKQLKKEGAKLLEKMDLKNLSYLNRNLI